MIKYWIDKVKKSGRFSDFQWNKKEKVKVATLDSMITEFGRPSFIKIDVVGFEYEVIQGLSEKVNNISIEFTPEYIDSTLASLNYLGNIYWPGLGINSIGLMSPGQGYQIKLIQNE